jgi:glyoxylase-like metal-dependent hydrolase (beta-lactamase superfamily II)
VTAEAVADVDQLIDERPGKELLVPAYDDEAVRLNDFIYRSGGTTASYLIATDDGRVIVNTGMGFEAPHHKRLFDAVCPGPTPYIITTQGHVDHLGGVRTFRDETTRYVAQANNAACQRDDQRIGRLRRSTASIWFQLGDKARAIAAANPGVPTAQDTPTPDITFEERLGLRVGDRDLELIATPGGETIDSCVVWLPHHRICFISNLVGPLFPHFPNFHTLRGDRYRFVEPYLASLRTLRELQPDLLVTGRHAPIAGRALIDASLGRLHDAVDYVHRETVRGINEGKDVLTLMQEIRLPERLRVGQAYGKVSWAVRTIWESYVGWFRLGSTTELYPVRHTEAASELVGLVGSDAAAARARGVLDGGRPVTAIQLAEAILANDPHHAAAVAVMVEAHQTLLAEGADENFWESGWLRQQIARWRGA